VNRIGPPDFFDDDAALTALANNHRLNSYPELQHHLAAILDGYQDYVAASGNAFNIAGVALPDAIKGYLRGHYRSRPKCLSFIKEIHARSGVQCCPMCGGLQNGSLDHLLPQEDHPAFAIFGPNLVPACGCNSIRGTALIGPNPGERILHPYYDDVLGERLLAARFDDLGPVPRVSLTILLSQASPDYAAVAFHVSKIVKRNSVITHLGNSWAKLLRKPSSICVALRSDPPSRAMLEAALSDQLEHEDDFHGSRNNWRSVFVKGLLDDHVLDWLFARFSIEGRDPDGALLQGIS
jgi:hypothetical protein